MNKQIVVGFLSFGVAIGAPVGWVYGQSNWTAGTGDWGVGGNWSAGVPNGVNAVVNNGGTANITNDQPNTNDLLVGRGAGTSGTVNHSASTTQHANQWQFIGVEGGSGTVNVSAGNFNQTSGGRNTWIGHANGTGLASVGVFNLTGTGSVNWDSTLIGRDTGGVGTYTHTSSGTTSTWTTNVGTNGGQGTFIQSAGTHASDRSSFIGIGAGSTGYVEVGGGLFRTGVGGLETRVGYDGGVGTFRQTNGTVIFDNERYGFNGGSGTDYQSGGTHSAWALTIANGAGSTGTLRMDGGTRTYAREVFIGTSGAAGHLDFNGGTLNVGTQMRWADGVSSTFTGDISGGQITANGISVGDDGAATVTHTDGIVNAGSWMVVGTFSGGAGTYTVDGGTVRTSGGENTIHVAQRAGTTGVFTMQTGATVETGAVRIGNAGGSNGTVNLEGGTLLVNELSNNGGTFTWDSATITHLTQFGQEGGIDYTDTAITGQPDAAAGKVVREGNIMSFTGTGADLTTLGSATLLLGDLYNNNGIRFNTLALDGALNLGGTGDTLSSILSPNLLRPTLGAISDFGSLPLVTAAGGITGEFDNFVTPIEDYLGFSEYTGVFTGVGDLPQNTWYLEYTNNGGGADSIIFHYHVEGTVPEPGTVGLLAIGLLFLRGLRRTQKV